MRERLAQDGLQAFAKTSGSEGLHLLVPVVPTPSARVSACARQLAVEAEAELPRLVAHRMTKALRSGARHLGGGGGLRPARGSRPPHGRHRATSGAVWGPHGAPLRTGAGGGRPVNGVPEEGGAAVLPPPVDVMRPRAADGIPVQAEPPRELPYPLKLNGFRVPAFVLDAGKVVLRSRSRRDLTPGIVLDGGRAVRPPGRAAQLHRPGTGRGARLVRRLRPARRPRARRARGAGSGTCGTRASRWSSRSGSPPPTGRAPPGPGARSGTPTRATPCCGPAPTRSREARPGRFPAQSREVGEPAGDRAWPLAEEPEHGPVRRVDPPPPVELHQVAGRQETAAFVRVRSEG
ncbi:hypothetical protein [Streptomyces sp. NPDC008122]|uniref:non-homologous end-joining DNA ligase LigD n=1 Tax=Streptomyces sp. NPDC008122 TaxID=3364810 RepID=UPI0036E14FE5